MVNGSATLRHSTIEFGMSKEKFKISFCKLSFHFRQLLNVSLYIFEICWLSQRQLNISLAISWWIKSEIRALFSAKIEEIGFFLVSIARMKGNGMKLELSAAYNVKNFRCSEFIHLRKSFLLRFRRFNLISFRSATWLDVAFHIFFDLRLLNKFWIICILFSNSLENLFGLSLMFRDSWLKWQLTIWQFKSKSYIQLNQSYEWFVWEISNFFSE